MTMGRRIERAWAALTAAAFLSLAGPVVSAEAVKVGVAAAVKGTVAILPTGGGSERRIKSGDAVSLGDTVRAGPDARLQVLLLDETVFTIGANSEIVIDRFVYDPGKSAGKVTASVAKGVFRFVTGRVSKNKPEDMEVRVPAGTIGVRGTMVAGRIADGTTQLALLGPGDESNTRETVGRIEVSNDAGSVVLSRSGFGTTVSQGVPPSAPAAVVGSDLNAMSALPAVPPGQAAASSSGNEGTTGSAGLGSATASGFTGQTVAAAVQSVAGTTAVASTGDQASDAAAEASEASVIEDGITQISDLPTTGTFHFGQDGVKLGTSGSYDISLDLDLGNRTAGGGNSKVSGTSGDSGLASFSFALLSKSLDSFTTAVFEDNPANANCTGDDTCSATLKMTLNNSGGAVAATMTHELELKNDTDSTSETGSGTATRSSGLTD